MEYAHQMEEELAQQTLSAVRILELLIEHAYLSHASDIHIDPGEEVLRIRIRIDGTLCDLYEFPKRLQSELLARLKILAGLRIDEHQMPQDGRFRINIPTSEANEAPLDVRLSIAPTYHGENAVLRLLSSRDTLTSLGELGLFGQQQRVLHCALVRPNGFILITGPTGSGKTSTLYALLHQRNSRESSIVTIEDPIEYAIDGITQMQARRTGFTFAEGLRSILRQDPNVIGIGEIRDGETAALAIHAALTGHLVLSTLHTTSAAAALPRLIDMGIEPYLVASTLQLVIHQRLVRRLCSSCVIREPIRPDQQQALAELLPLEASRLIEYAVAPGCKECGGVGTSGRIGLFEVLPLSTELRDAAMRKCSVQEVSTIANEQGMQTLLMNGIQKVGLGLVSLDEILALAYE